MSKKAFVFDTNFIIQNYNLNDVVKNLNEKGFVVYITQVAIDERIAQECIKQRAKYDKLESFKKEVEGFASITITEPYEKTEKLYKDLLIKVKPQNEKIQNNLNSQKRV